jgi:tRNA threonylcarbamoyladenosine modification (KEOPS) complex  Pcc1 subunit
LYSAVIKLNLGERSEDYVAIVDKDIDYKRSRVTARKGRGSLIINIEAEDQVALFASMNSMLKQLRIIGNVDKKMDELGED